MPISPEVQAYIRAVAVALFGVVASALGILAVGAFGDYFRAYPVYTPLMLTKSLGVDVLGAIIPLLAVALSAAVFLRIAKSPVRKLAAAFGISALLAFTICHQTADGVAGYPLLYAFLVSIVAAAVNLYPRRSCTLKSSITASLALAIFCVPLSLFLVDLAYVPNFYGALIGGNGLADGLILSTLYVPLTVAVVYSATTYISVTFNLVKMSQTAGKVKPPKEFAITPSESSSAEA